MSEPEIVVVGPQYLSAIIAASDNVREASGDFDPWHPEHGDDEFIAAANPISTK